MSKRVRNAPLSAHQASLTGESIRMAKLDFRLLPDAAPLAPPPIGIAAEGVGRRL